MLENTPQSAQPIITVKEARKMLGLIVRNFTDDEVIQLILATQEAVTGELRKSTFRKSTMVE